MAFVVSYIVTPYIAQLGEKQNFVDKPGYRKIHDNAVPNLGGVVIFFGFLFSVLIFVSFSRQVKIIIIGSIVILLLGIVDDIVNLRPWPKFVIQIFTAILFISFHNDIISKFIDQNLYFLPVLSYLIYPVLLLWIVGVTNAINLIDGLDGLASGISIISLGSFLLLGFLAEGNYQEYNLLNAALLGSIMAFFRYNFYPAQIFLGDSGSTFTGFIISSNSLLWVIYSGKLIYFLIPLTILALPIFDTLFAIWRRLKSHTPIFQADQGHLHHRLLMRGISHRNVVLILLSISSICSLMTLAFYYFIFL